MCIGDLATWRDFFKVPLRSESPFFGCWPFRVIMCAVGGGVAFSILAIGRWRSSSIPKRYKEGSFLPFQSLLLSPPLSFDPLRILLLLPLLRPRSHRKWEERTLSLHFSSSFLPSASLTPFPCTPPATLTLAAFGMEIIMVPLKLEQELESARSIFR